MRCSQEGQDILRQDAAVLRHVPRLIRTMCAQQSVWFSGRTLDVLAPLQLATRCDNERSDHGQSDPDALQPGQALGREGPRQQDGHHRGQGG
jgi:hypothetical protein